MVYKEYKGFHIVENDKNTVYGKYIPFDIYKKSETEITNSGEPAWEKIATADDVEDAINKINDYIEENKVETAEQPKESTNKWFRLWDRM